MLKWFKKNKRPKLGSFRILKNGMNEYIVQKYVSFGIIAMYDWESEYRTDSYEKALEYIESEKNKKKLEIVWNEES